MATTSIEWSTHVWNPTAGCDRVSPGCDHCYAMTMAKRLKGMGQAKYQGDGDPRTSGPGFLAHEWPDALDWPLTVKKPMRVFVNSMSDLFHDRISDEYIARVFAVMALAPQHTFQVLTKRHARMRSVLSNRDFAVEAWRAACDLRGSGDYSAGYERILMRDRWPGPACWPLPNVWLGVSVENQQWETIRGGALRETPAAVRFYSAEPLLGPITANLDGIGWVIVGGESGPGARPMHPDWARSLRDQCVAAGVPFMFKQWGSWTANRIGLPPTCDPTAWASWNPEGLADPAVVLDQPDFAISSGWTGMHKASKKVAGRVLDGRTWDEYPAAAS